MQTSTILKGYKTILDLGVERIQSADRVTIFHERENWDFAWD